MPHTLELHQNEEVHGIFRKTWLVFLPNLVLGGLLFLAPFVLLPLFTHVPLEPIQNLTPTLRPFLFLFTAVWWWIVWLWGFVAFINYYFDIFVVTNERVMHIEQHGPFSRTINELRLERIQDVTVEQHGMLPTLLHFGDVRVQTAGEMSSFEFITIPNPMEIKQLLMDAHREAMAHRENPAQELFDG